MKNPQAFPSTEETYYDEIKTNSIYYPGMTLRDYFAGQVLAGLSNDLLADNAWKSIADYAYSIADLMLERREK